MSAIQAPSSSFKKHNQNEEMKSKLSDAMDAVPGEERSLAWETNSSRCSTSHASETSITSGVYSMENSYTDCSLMEERKTTQEIPSNSTHQTPNEKIGTVSQECDFSRRSALGKAEEREFDRTDPQSWPSQVQPSKIKDYLVQITQEVVTSVSEEKENALMKKGELPLKGTVRARIVQITAVLEERNKKIFRRVNNKDLPPPSEVVKKPREPPKVFSKRGISVSLRHVEQNTVQKDSKKEVPGYNLRHVETKRPKSALYSKEQKQPQHSFLPKMQNKPSEKLPKISTNLADKAKKPETKQYSPATQISLPELIQPAESDKREKREKQSLSPNTSNTTPEKSFNFVDEIEKREIQAHSPMALGISNILKEVRPLSEKEIAQPCSPVPAELLPYVAKETENQSDSTRTVLSETSIQHVQYPHNITATHCEPERSNLTEITNHSMKFTIPSPLEVKGTPFGQERMEEQFTALFQTKSDQLPLLSLVQESGTQEIESVSDLAAMHGEPEVSDLAEIRNQVRESTTPSEMEVNGTPLEHSVEEAEKQAVPLYSTETKDAIPEKPRLPSSVKEGEKQEKEELAKEYPEKERVWDKLTTPFETKSDQRSLFGCLDHKAEACETEPAFDLAAVCREPEVSDLAEIRNQVRESTTPPEMEVKGTPLEHPVEEAEKQAVPLYSTEAKNAVPEKPRLPSTLTEGEKQETEQLLWDYSDKEKVEDQLTMLFQKKSGHLPLVHKSEGQETEPAPDLASMTQEIYKTIEEPPGPSEFSCFMVDEEPKREEKLKSDLARQAAQSQPSLTTLREAKHPVVFHLRDKAETQVASTESWYPDSTLSIPDAQEEETQQHSTAPAQSEPEQLVTSQSIKAPHGPKEILLLNDKVTGPLISSEQLLSTSSLLTASVEKHGTQPPLLKTAAPLFEQPNSNMPCLAQQMKKQSNLSDSTEVTPVIAEASFPTVPFQNAEITKEENRSLSSAEVLSKELISKSRETEVATDTKTGQLFPTLSAQHPGEELNLENQLHPAIKVQSDFEKRDKSSCAISEDLLEHSLESESKKHFTQQNSTVSSQLEGTTPLHSVNEIHKKIMQPDKPTTKPLHPDSLHPGFESSQTVAIQQQTPQHLSQTLLPMELDTVQLGEEKEINGIQSHLPAARQVLSQLVYSMDTQENQGISGTAAQDTGLLSSQLNKADAEDYGIADPESKHLAKQAVEPITAQLETHHTNRMHFMSELGKHLDVSFPVPSTEGEGLPMPIFVTAESEDEQPLSSKKEREENECCAPIIPTSKLKGSASETQGNQNDLSNALNEASGSPPLILSFVPDKTKPQAILTESVGSSVPASQQSNVLSSEPTDKTEIGKNNFPFPESQEVLSDLPFFTTSSIKEVRKEPLHSSMATKIVSEESRSIPDDATSREINERSPFSSALSAEQLSVEPISSYGASEEEKQVWSHSIFNEEPMDVAAGKANMEDTQSHLLVIPHSENRSQDSKLQGPVALQPELEGLTLLNSTEEKPKQETLLCSPPTVPQEILYRQEEKEDQEGITSETECSKEQDDPLKDDNFLQPVKESQLEEIQLYCSATLQDSSQLADISPQEQEDYLPTTGEVDSDVSILSQLMDDAEKQEIQTTWCEAAQIECKPSVLSVNEMKPVQHPSFTAPLDTRHLDLSDSKKSELYSFEEQNQISEQEPLISSILTKKVKETEENSYPSLVSTSLLSPSSSVTLDPVYEEKKEEKQPCTPIIAKVMPEEPMSIAAFLLSEAKVIDIFFPQASEKQNLDTQSPFGEADLINGSTVLPEKNAMTERKTESPPTHFESEHFESEPQVERVISTKHLSKTKETKHLPSMEGTLKVPENHLCKEKEFKDQEKLREEGISALNLDQGKDTVNISGSCEVVKTNASLISSVDRKKLIPEAVETISLLETKAFNDARDVAVDNEPSVYKPSGKCSEDLKVDHNEKTENESKELDKEKDIKESTETEKEVWVIPENKDDSIFNNTNIDYIETYTLIDNTSFTQTGKEKSIQEAQRPFSDINKQYVEAIYPAANSEKILELSLLERDNGMIEKEHTTATHEDISKIANENEMTDAVRNDDKNTEHEFNLVDANAVLFHSEKDELSQSPAASLPMAEVDSEVLELPPALAFLCKDLYEEAVGDSKKHSHKCKEVKDTDLPFHIKDRVPDDGIGMYLEKDIPRDYTPNNVEESKKEDILKGQPINEETLTQPKVIDDVYEPNEKMYKPVDIQPDLSAQVEEYLSDILTNRATEIVSDIKIEICQPTHAIPFGRGFYSSGASSDDSDQRREEQSLSEETGQLVPEETSDEESSPILNYAATVYQTEPSGQGESKNAAEFAVTQNQQSEITEVHGMDEDVVVKPAEKNAQSLEVFSHTDRQSERQLEISAEPTAQDTQVLDHKDLPCWDTEVQKFENRIGENNAQDLTQYDTETADQLATEAKSDNPFQKVDYSLLSHDFDTYPLYSIKEEEDSDIDEDLAELLNYEVVSRDDVFQEEISSETVPKELFDDQKSLDSISDTYEFVNEREASMYAEEKGAESLDLEMLQRNVPECEFLQKEVDQEYLDTYCYQCKCPISSEDKLFEEHKDHKVADLGTAVTVLKSQLDGFLDVLQQRSLKIEGCVSEIEALFNTLEENCKEKEKLLEEQNENVVKMVFGHHDRKAQNFEEAKNTKMEYLYEQMVNFQDYIDTAKETLEMIINETEDIDDFAFLKSSEEINKRLLSAVENIVTLEKMPAAFSQFEPCAGGFTNSDRTLQHAPVPHTPKLQPQDPNSATSTSIAVYWTVNEDDLIDFFQVYCMEGYPGSKEQSGFNEEYRVIVKESNCILEDLEPGHCYSVWVMAINYAGCSFPSDKSIFRTAPPTPEIKSEDCTVCWDTATIRWSTSNLEATDFFTLEFCRQYSPEGEGLRSLAGIQHPEIKVHLESNINYFFYVRAVNAFGTSEQSEAALISTKGTRFQIMREIVHPVLQVSPNGTMISLLDDTNLAGISPVLGELLPAQGWHYWEITVSSCGAYKVGICSSMLPESSDLGQKNGSWCLHCSSKTSSVYKVLHNGQVTEIIVTEQPARIGILLDYNTGTLLFLNAERGQVLSAIKYKFTEAAYPAFVLEQLGFLNLHTGMELPEFVKQS
ncbi:cardiomyopathy-associated protein 5 isoform 3-T3 [Liasis olivaceus]